MLEPRKTATLYLAFRRCWKVWRGPTYFPALTSTQPVDRLRWTRHPSSTLPLQWGHWVSLSVSTVRYHVPEFPHSSATFNIISGSHILTSPKVLQGALGDSACPTQCSQPCPVPANRHLTGLTWFPIVLYYIK